ncbi:hypothetical protein [Couchioplanes caeruleus]|uniref:Uncharacterized protein n=2 Tax=Couchioplanes caeruleus TaxID=56438 RepID=A0A1K0FPI3_9ACTN|nr:hypothetical protein [Couchioplanes caeruleus]OJF14757.1 hypothetical protein BG844_07975 [Couchioplanes caeruleus subsp. caeruleus]ROP28090.1 hypothetical protein EDD30_0798 [Couchioplanes caeruleus]
MSQTRTPDTRPPAPVGLLLRPTHTHRPADPAGRPLPDWYGIHPDHVALLIARYTRDGDTVLDSDGHPTIAAAAEHLHRRHGIAVTEGQHPHVWPEPLDGHSAATARHGAGLVLATLPRLDIDSRDPHAISQALGAWHRLLRPGGFLVLLLTTGPGGAFGHRSTVIAAARTAGLLYHQHIPALLVPLPEAEPRTETRPVSRPPLRGGRHVPAHRDLLAFASITPEAADV